VGNGRTAEVERHGTLEPRVPCRLSVDLKTSTLRNAAKM
jgi:hypothetical protein